jgi:hypothetical protein
MRPIRITMAAAAALLVVITLGATSADAMPMFARKFGVTCAYCHTTIPRLNQTGFKFRAAGFRLPETMGKPQPPGEKKFELGDNFSARIQSRFDSQATNQPNGAPIANCPGNICGSRATTTAFSFMEATLYPLTGSWGDHFGSLSELSVSPEDFFEIENAYIRAVAGTEKSFFTSRIGIFHPWEGFGASDRPFSNARTLFQTSPLSAAGRGIPYVFQPWGLDEAGAEVGGEFDKLSVRAAVLGGTFMRFEEEANTFIAFPAQTGPWKGANQAVAALGKPVDSVGHNSVDFSANAQYLLHPEGGVVSLLYYHGSVATPTHCSDGTPIGSGSAAAGTLCGVSAAGDIGNTDFDFTKASAFQNNFDRVAIYASYPFGKFLPMAGYQYGRDDIPVSPATFPANSALDKFTSNGAFVEGAYTLHQYVTGGVRWDRFHPNTARLNTSWAVTPYVNIPLQNGFQIIAEYQHRDFQLDATNSRQNDTFQVRVIFIQ